MSTIITTTQRTIHFTDTLKNMEEYAKSMHYYLDLSPEDMKKLPTMLHGGVWATAKEIYRLFEWLSRKGKANLDQFAMETITSSIATKLRRSTRTIRRHIDILIKLKFISEKKRASKGIILTLNQSLISYTEKTVQRVITKVTKAVKRVHQKFEEAKEKAGGMEAMGYAFLANYHKNLKRSNDSLPLNGHDDIL